IACIRRPATITCPNSVRDVGQRARVINTIGIMHRMPNRKRKVRNVNGAAYSMPILDARKPEPQITTKYHASRESNQRWRETAALTKRHFHGLCERNCEYNPKEMGAR